MENNKEAAKAILKKWDKLIEEFRENNKQQILLSKRYTEILNQLETLERTLELLGERPKNLIIPLALLFKSGGTIGDNIEKLLQERGSLTRKEITNALVIEQRVSLKNARVVVFNAVRKDTKKRFIESKDGKVSLRKENEK